MSVPVDSPEFSENLSLVRERITRACAAAGRPLDEVALMAVTKTQPAEAVALAWDAGLRTYGENRVQELVAKQEALARPASWELIGHLQSNKARLAVAHAARIQSVDRLKLVQLLARLVEEGLALAPFPILLQVNAGEDPAKYGCTVEEAPALLEAAQATGQLTVEGLMTIAPLDGDPAVARRCFARLRALRERLAADSGLPLATLSMGMTGDLEEAIAEGSTLVRVGSALFGARPPGSRASLRNPAAG